MGVARRLTEVYTAHQSGSRPPSMRQSLSRPALCSYSLLKSVRVAPGISALLPVLAGDEANVS